MARTPILNRKGFVTFINRNIQPQVTRHLDCNVVETELGTMVEPRNFFPVMENKVTDLDPLDAAYNSETLMDESAFWNQYNTYITQRPFDFQY